jgi:hypothetical protein
MQWIIAIGAGVAAWAIYPYFLSGSQRWRLSPVAFWSNRIALAAVAVFIAGIVFDQSRPSTGSDLPKSAPPDKPAQAPSAAPEDKGPRPEKAVVEGNPRQEKVDDKLAQNVPSPATRPDEGIHSDSKAPSVAPVPAPAPVIAAIDCARQSAEFEKLVCSDAPLREQEHRIIGFLQVKLEKNPSPQVADEVRVAIAEFRGRLAKCVLKSCIENAYDEFEKKWAGS